MLAIFALCIVLSALRLIWAVIDDDEDGVLLPGIVIIVCSVLITNYPE